MYCHRRYVMDTYSNDHNRRTNHGLAAFHSFASWGVVLPATTGECWGLADFQPQPPTPVRCWERCHAAEG